MPRNISLPKQQLVKVLEMWSIFTAVKTTTSIPSSRCRQLGRQTSNLYVGCKSRSQQYFIQTMLHYEDLFGWTLARHCNTAADTNIFSVILGVISTSTWSTLGYQSQRGLYENLWLASTTFLFSLAGNHHAVSFIVWSAWLRLRGMCCVAGIKIIKRSQSSFPGSWLY